MLTAVPYRCPGWVISALAEQQPYQYPDNWLYGARSFRLVDVTPWRDAKPSDRVWRLCVTYNLPDPEPRTEGLVVGVDRGVRNPTTVAKSDGSTVCYDGATSFRNNQRRNDNTRRRLSKQTFAQLSGDGAPARPPQLQERMCA